MALGKILDRKTNMEQCLSCKDSRLLSNVVWRLETEQAIKLLCHKHEDPSSDLQQPPNKHMVAHAYKYRTVRWGWRLENSQDLQSAGLVHVVKFLTTERPHSKSKVESVWGPTLKIVIWPPRAFHGREHLYPLVCPHTQLMAHAHQKKCIESGKRPVLEEERGQQKWEESNGRQTETKYILCIKCLNERLFGSARYIFKKTS